MKKFLLCLTILFFIENFCLTSPSLAELQEHKMYRVTRVIDGDTIKLDSGDRVRLIGIDTPEIRGTSKLQKELKTRHLRKKEELVMGRKAYIFTKRLIEGKKIRLEFDQLKYDNYHRVLAYVYLANGVFVNAQIIKAGYAYVYAIKPYLRHASEFDRLQQEAKDHHRGIWQHKKNPHQRIQWFSSK